MSRVLGLDLARGLAVLGMVAAHVGHDGADRGPYDGWTWLTVSHGHPSALFATLAGVTLTLMTARAGDDARGLRRTRARVAARAGVLIVMGLALELLGTPVAVILANLGVMMLLMLPVLRAPTWLLAGLAAACLAFGTVAVEWLRPDGALATVPVVEALWWVRYPALSWSGYLLAGLAIGRLRLREATAQAGLVGGGLMLVGATGVVHAVAPGAAWASVEPHSYAPVEMMQNLGVAGVTIGACCWLAPRASFLLSPVTALGSMALSAYVAHLLAIAIVGPEMVWYPSNTALIVLSLALLAGAWAWRRYLGRGPLERMLTAVADAAGDAVSPPRARVEP